MTPKGGREAWRVKIVAGWALAAPVGAMVLVVAMSGGGAANEFVVDAHTLAGPRQDSVFDGLLDDVPAGPGVDGSLGSQKRSQIEVPVIGTTGGKPAEPGTPATGTATGIPGTVLAAYQKVAGDLAVTAPGCHLTWPLLAGIGKVESAHASGGRVDTAGTTRGHILGPVLDGGPGMASISDTDGGRYDGDAAWDRAVGPMQFIPSTWAGFGADGNGDGVTDPHNVFDASRAAGEYLCSGGSDLSDPQGLVAAVLRYNHSMDYVSTVLRWMQSYSASTVPTPDDQRVIGPPADDDGKSESDPEDLATHGRTEPTEPIEPTEPTTLPTGVPTTAPATTRPTVVPSPSRATPTVVPSWSLTTPKPSTRPPWTQPSKPSVTKPPAPSLTPEPPVTSSPVPDPETPTPTETTDPVTPTPEPSVTPTTIPDPTITP